MTNLRILYAGALSHLLSPGDIFSKDSLIFAGISPAEILARGDAEETDADATCHLALSGPAAEPAADPAVADAKPAATPAPSAAKAAK